MLRPTVFFLCIFLSSSLLSQERAGLALGKYNGLSSLGLNPAFAFKSANKWDVQLAGGHIFAQTDYAHITNTNLFSLLGKSSDVFIPESTNDIVADRSLMIMQFNESGKTSADLKGEVLGPGLMIPLGEKIKVSLSTRLRGMAVSYDIPSELNYYTARSLTSDSIYTMPTVSGSGMAWAEINLHYAQKLDEKITFGVSLKFLKEYATVYARNNTSFEYSEFAANQIDIVSGGSFRIAFPTTDGTVSGLGNGFGLDVGITIKEAFDSRFELGISLLDLGYIFNGTIEEYSFDTTLSLDSEDYNNIETHEALREQLEMDFVNVSSSSFYMQLPTALAIQYATALTPQLSIEGYWIQRLQFSPESVAVHRANSINLSAVYDRKYFSAFLPITLYNYSDFRIGAALRLGILTLGSDKVLSLFGKRDFTGTDIYANIQVHPFNLRKRKNKSKKDSKVQCYW